ncbi:hypothetical protein Psi02_71790 [Planotetraspora silvatica]|uniref:Uncharacterized protein n=1 Tax=Planotetraspora silvatica TaxID=234614 RepID=A0A8J3UU49_9ACTN|nr:hypothetical protein [Planotetraspora silvatica]GII50755.1 hypothetical protein Psi02_71790 [Planotetraspora silvatica]
MRPPRRLSRWRLVLIGLATVLTATTLVSVPASADGPIIRPTTPPVRPTLLPPPPTFFPTPPPTFPPIPPSDPTPNPQPTCPPDCAPPRTLKIAGAGDSYTSGEGATHDHKYLTFPDGSEDFRHQSGYAPLPLAWDYLQSGRYPTGQYTVQPDEISTTWGTGNSDRFIFNASSGAKVSHLTDVQFEDEDHTDIHEVRNVRQLAGVPRDLDIFYFGLGGNDADFGPLMKMVLIGHYSTVGTDTYISRRKSQARLVHYKVQQLIGNMPQVSANVEQGLVNVKDATDNAEIVVALYPLPVKPSGNTDHKQIGGLAMDEIYPFAVALNQAIKDAVDRFRTRFPQRKVHVFDPNTAGPNGTSVVAGHELGQPDSYFNGVISRTELLARGKIFNALQESFHPNELGSVAIGRALATWMAGEFPAFFPNGPDFNRVITNPQAAADDPEADQELEEWVRANPGKLCDGDSIDSICHFIGPDGDVTIPLEVLLNPIRLKPIPGAPTVGGSGGGGSSGGPAPSSWIPATYSSAPSGVPAGGISNTPTGDPCDLLVKAEPGLQVAVSSSTLSGGGLQAPMDLTWVHFLTTDRADPCQKGEKIDPEKLREQAEAWLNGGPLPE